MAHVTSWGLAQEVRSSVALSRSEPSALEKAGSDVADKRLASDGETLAPCLVPRATGLKSHANPHPLRGREGRAVRISETAVRILAARFNGAVRPRH
jgi:hypothetical protein